MEKLSMCRICFAQDVRMQTIINTHLEDMYEKLSDKMFMTKDIRPVQACYVCYARLQNCYQLKMNCLQSEELFNQMLSSNMTSETMLLKIPVTKTLSVTPVTHLTTGVTIKKAKACDIKTEPLEVTDDVEVKMERSEDDLETCPEETELQLEDVQLADKTNDVPLIFIKVEPNDIGADDLETCPEENELQLEDVQLADKTNDVPLIFIKVEPNDIGADVPELEEAEREYLEEIPSSAQEEIRDNNKNIKNNNKTPINQSQILKNKRDHKLKQNFQQCEVCKTRFKNIFDLAKHDCLRNQLACDICDKEFSNIYTLGVHKRIHSGQKPYSCTICYKSFTDKSTLNKHNLVHTNEKPYKCGTCKKGFKRKSHLTTHILVHTNAKPYQCDVCKKSFSQKGHLRCHTKIHLGDKNKKLHFCDVCKNCFSARSCLVRHMRRTHNL